VPLFANSIVLHPFACWPIWLYIRNNEHFWQTNQIDVPLLEVVCLTRALILYRILRTRNQEPVADIEANGVTWICTTFIFLGLSKVKVKPTACDSFLAKSRHTRHTHTLSQVVREREVCGTLSIPSPSTLSFRPELASLTP